MRTERPQPPSAPTEQASVDRPAPAPSGTSEVLFHIGGVVILVGVAAVGAVFAFFVSWGATVCNADVTDPRFVDPYRRDLLLVVLAVAAFPALWAALAKLANLAWVPWVLVSAAIVVAGAVTILPVDEVGRWCF
jgi:hypothetical protein